MWFEAGEPPERVGLPFLAVALVGAAVVAASLVKGLLVVLDSSRYVRYCERVSQVTPPGLSADLAPGNRRDERSDPSPVPIPHHSPPHSNNRTFQIHVFHRVPRPVRRRSDRRDLIRAVFLRAARRGRSSMAGLCASSGATKENE